MDDDDVVCLSSDDDLKPSKKLQRFGKSGGIDFEKQTRLTRRSNNNSRGSRPYSKPQSVVSLAEEEEEDEIIELETEEDRGGDSSDDCQVLEDFVNVPVKRKRPTLDSREVKEKETLNLIRVGEEKRFRVETGSDFDTDTQVNPEEKEPVAVSVSLPPPVEQNSATGSQDQNRNEGSDGGGNPEDAQVEIDYAIESKRALTGFLDVFFALNKLGNTKEKAIKARTRAWAAYDSIRSRPALVHKRLIEEIGEATWIIQTTRDQFWTMMHKLLKMMTPEGCAALAVCSEEDQKRDREQVKLDLRMKYEKKLEEIQEEIRVWAEKEVDWDQEDDQNSPYIMAHKYKEKFMQKYYTLCDLAGCNRFTGRPNQTKINLEKHGVSTGHRKVDEELEKWVNKQGFMFVPDYTDILEVIGKVNDLEHLGLGEQDLVRTAQKIFAGIMKLIKKRRGKDLGIALLPMGNDEMEEEDKMGMEVEGDPADEDEELRRKLEENEKLKKNEGDVIARFAKLEKDRKEGGGGYEVESEEEDDDDTKVDSLETEELVEEEDEVVEC